MNVVIDEHHTFRVATNGTDDGKGPLKTAITLDCGDFALTTRLRP